MSSSHSNPLAEAEDSHGCLWPLSSKVDPITFAKESDRTMWTLGRGEFNAAVLPSPAISELYADRELKMYDKVCTMLP